jgi:hypothetical protein
MNIMFKTFCSYKLLEKAGQEIIDNVKQNAGSTIYVIPHHYNKSRPMPVYPQPKTEYEEFFPQSAVLYLPTPPFTNIRWLLEVVDYPNGGIGGLFMLGTLRSRTQRAALVGDWKGQTFDITSLLDEELIPPHLKELEVHEQGYNEDSSIVQGIGTVLISASNASAFKK